MVPLTTLGGLCTVEITIHAEIRYLSVLSVDSSAVTNCGMSTAVSPTIALWLSSPEIYKESEV